MSTVVQRRRGTTAEHATFTGALGELTVDTTKDTVVVHDGATAGGFPLMRQDFANATSQLAGMRNKIIDGKMEIDQRNAGSSVTANDNVFAVDRFRFSMTQSSKGTGQRSTVAPARFINSLLFTSTAATSLGAGDQFAITQPIEGVNVSDLGWGAAGAQTVTLSFLVRSSLTGTFGGSLQNSAANRSYPFSYSISAANTWEQKSITVTGDTSGTWLTNNGIGIRLNFSLGMGSTFSGTAGAWVGSNIQSVTGATSVVGTNGATFYITGVQLEVGSVATPFEHRPYGLELALCQRYYQEIGAAGANEFVYQFYSSASQVNYLPFAFPVRMRTSPTAVVAGTWTGSSFDVTTSSVGCRLNITSAVGTNAIQNSGSGAKLTFSAEL